MYRRHVRHPWENWSWARVGDEPQRTVASRISATGMFPCRGAATAQDIYPCPLRARIIQPLRPNTLVPPRLVHRRSHEVPSSTHRPVAGEQECFCRIMHKTIGRAHAYLLNRNRANPTALNDFLIAHAGTASKRNYRRARRHFTDHTGRACRRERICPIDLAALPVLHRTTCRAYFRKLISAFGSTRWVLKVSDVKPLR